MDDEITAMQAMAGALAGLDESARGRVIRWLGERYGVRAAQENTARQQSVRDAEGQPEQEEFPDFFHRFQASTDKEKAVATAYWLRLTGVNQFPSMDINSMLKDLGHRVSNITDALSSAMREKPALVIQIKKSGSSRQARKLYKLTDAGAKWVESKLAGREEK